MILQLSCMLTAIRITCILLLLLRRSISLTTHMILHFYVTSIILQFQNYNSAPCIMYRLEVAVVVVNVAQFNCWVPRGCSSCCIWLKRVDNWLAAMNHDTWKNWQNAFIRTPPSLLWWIWSHFLPISSPAGVGCLLHKSNNGSLECEKSRYSVFVWKIDFLTCMHACMKSCYGYI